MTLGISRLELSKCFPHDEVRPDQESMLDAISGRSGQNGILIEAPTGSGKNSLAIAAAHAAAKSATGPVLVIEPTKVLVEQQMARFREHENGTPGHRALPILGRADYECLFYEDGTVNAHDSPCYMLDCGHRVSQATGKTRDDGAEPCTYYQAKHDAFQAAHNGTPIVTTTAFAMMNMLFVGGWKDLEPALTIVDEAHTLARVARRLFVHQITDYHLYRIIGKLELIGSNQTEALREFAGWLVNKARSKPSREPRILEQEDVVKMIALLQRVDAKQIESDTHKAMESGAIDPVNDRAELKTLESAVRGIPNLVRMLAYSLDGEENRALNYVVATYYIEDDPEVVDQPRRRARIYLKIHAYYVGPIIRKTLGKNFLGLSATIGDADIWKNESGLDVTFHQFSSDWDPGNTRVFIPIDGPYCGKKPTFGSNLYKAIVEHGRRQCGNNGMKQARKMIEDTCLRFAEQDVRVLVVVSSNAERKNIAFRMKRQGIPYLTYGNGMTAKEAVTRFRAGEAMVLIGTDAQYAEGVDFPAGIAPVIIYMKPTYPPPSNPQTQFENRRFTTSKFWMLQNWRVMMRSLQVRGRNIRSSTDKGVCIFIDWRFNRFLYACLPKWLKASFDNQLTLDECIDATLELLTEPD
jgi:hypothetical protein